MSPSALNPEDEKTLKGLRKDSAYTRLAGGFREYGVGAAFKGIGEGAAAGGGNGAAALGVGMGLGGIVAGVGMPSPGGGARLRRRRGRTTWSSRRAGRARRGRSRRAHMHELPGAERSGIEILRELRYGARAQSAALYPMRLGRGAGSEVLRQLRDRARDMRRGAARRAAIGGRRASAPRPAFGRAGGGGHSGGGGGTLLLGRPTRSISGSGGSLNGVVGLLIVGLIIYFFIRRARRGAPSSSLAPHPPSSGGDHRARRGCSGQRLGGARSRAAAADVGSDAARRGVCARPSIEIRARDPGFELELFLQRAEMTFFLVKRGMQQNDAAAVRPYLSDPCIRRRLRRASRRPRRGISMRFSRA